MNAAQWAQLTVGVIAIIAAAWGFYTGWLPRWLRRQIGFYELKSDVEAVKDDTNRLHADHQETMAEIETLKAGQVDIAETVANEHNGVNVDKLRQRHFGADGTDVPGDFLHDVSDD